MIEKNIRLQPHHARDLLVGRRSDGQRPGYQPPGGGATSLGSGRDVSGGGGGGGGEGGGGHAAQAAAAQHAARQRAATHAATQAAAQKAEIDRQQRVAEQAAAEKQRAGMIAGPIQGLISQPRTEAPPGEKGGAGYVSPEDLQKQEFRKIIAQGQEEKFGDTADPTKFGERAVRDPFDIPEDERTIEDKLAIEDWEKDQDWDKVKELADRGHSSDDIQKAMDKGLLMKQDSIRRQGLIERGLAALKPTTKLESSLLSNLTSKFDPKSMIGNMLKSTVKSAAMKKLGLGWLNPILGIASLFGLPQKAKSMIASRRAPTFDPKKASQLGLYADRQPTGITQQARVGQGTIGDKIVRGEVDLAKLITGGISPELQKLMAKGKSYSETDIIPSKYQGANLAKFAGAKVTDRNEMKQNTQKFVDMYKEGKYDNLQQAIEDADKYNAGEKTNYEKVTGKPLPDVFSEKLQEGLETYGEKVSESEKRQQELLKEMGLARGGRIDKPLMGRSRDI